LDFLRELHAKGVDLFLPKTMQARVEGMIGDELDLVEAELAWVGGRSVKTNCNAMSRQAIVSLMNRPTASTMV
jgi:hypothetical protein